MLSKVLEFIKNIFKYQKRRIFLYGALTVVFLYFLFPFNDLSDLVSSKVAEATAGQVFVGFDKLDLTLIPTPGLSLSNVSVESGFFPPLKAKYLEASPSVMGLLTFKPGLTVRGNEVLGGDFVLSTRGGSKTKAGTMEQKMDLDFENLHLADLIGLLDAGVKVTGSASGRMTSDVDMDFTEQPRAEIQMNLSKVLVDESDINMQGMPFTIPKISVNQVEVQAKAEKGNLDITKFNIGRPGQDISAQISGRVGLTFEKQGFNVVTRPGAYDLNIRFQVSESLKQKVGVYLGLLSNYQVAANTYSLKIAGNGFYGPPSTITKGP